MEMKANRKGRKCKASVNGRGHVELQNENMFPGIAEGLKANRV